MSQSHINLDSIANPKELEFAEPSLQHDKEPTTEEQLYNAIMAKMNVRTSNVEDTIRKSNDREPQGESHPSRHNNTNSHTNTETTFKEVLRTISDDIGRRDADSIIDDAALTERVDGIMGKQSMKPRGKKGFSVEIEASFGAFGINKKGFRTFYPGIKSHSDFVDLKNFLADATILRGKRKDAMFTATDIEDVVELMKDDDDRKGNIRCRYDVLHPYDKIFERKIRNNKNAVEISDIGVRITYSTENKDEDLSAYESESAWFPHLVRNRRRTTFTTRDSSHPFFGFQVDATAVTESYMSWDKSGESSVDKKILKYEVEIEVMSSTVTKTGKEFIDFIMYVYSGLIGNSVPESEERQVFFTMPDRKHIVNLHNSLFTQDIERTKWRNNTGYTLFDKTYWNKPVNIKMDNLLPRFVTDDKSTFHLATAFPTLKLNGRRMFLLFLEEECWMLAPPYKVARFGSHSLGEKAAGTYIDGEFFRGTFWAFDILFDSGKDLRRLWFTDRQTLLKKYIGPHVTPYYGNVELKKFHTKGDIYERLRAAATEYEERMAEDEDSVDGIIIQPANDYSNKNTLKWKPAQLLTIDFRMNPIPEKEIGSEMYPGVNSSNYDRAFALSVGFNSDIFNPKPIRNADGEMVGFNGIIFVDDSIEHAKWVDTIAECKWEDEEKTFVPIRIRDDRFQPNNFNTALDVWRDIHNPIALTTITGEDLVTMRKMHNRIKESMLRRFLKEADNILDIGSGRGGDLSKWSKLKLNNVFAIEPNEENAEEFTRRLDADKAKFEGTKIHLPKIRLLNVGAEDTEDIEEEIGDVKLDAMVSFFSLTFFGESEAKYEGLLNTIKLIPEGGYFIGAVMDGERVHKLLSKERVKQSRSHATITKEIDEHEEEIKVLMKNPLRNKDKVAVLSKKVEDLREEAYSYLPHAELQKMIKSTRKLLIKDKKSLETAENTKASTREIERIKGTIKNRTLYIEKLEAILQQDEAEPLEEDDVVVFNNNVFEIAQLVDFDTTDYIGNKIGITINDPTSMVKDQIEWLFNFNVFIEKMNGMGFTLLESRFIDGKDVSFLSKEAFTFSALNRVFCFRRGEPIENEILPSKVGKMVPLAAERGMIVEAVPTKYGSFIHAILSAVDEEYQSLESVEEKDAYVLNMRNDIAEEITMEEFQHLHAGEMAKRMAHHQKRIDKLETDEEAMEAAFAKYKERLTTDIAEVGDVSLLEVMSDRFNVAIYIIGVRDSNAISTYYYSSNKVYCTEVLNHKNAIILAKSDEFYLVGSKKDEEVNYMFTKTDTFIKKLHMKICGKQSITKNAKNHTTKSNNQKDIKQSTTKFPVSINIPTSSYPHGFPSNKLPKLDDKKIVFKSQSPINIVLSYASDFLPGVNERDVNISKHALLKIDPENGSVPFVLTSDRNEYTLYELANAVVQSALTQEDSQDVWHTYKLVLDEYNGYVHLTQESNH